MIERAPGIGRRPLTERQPVIELVEIPRTPVIELVEIPAAEAGRWGAGVSTTLAGARGRDLRWDPVIELVEIPRTPVIELVEIPRTPVIELVEIPRTPLIELVEIPAAEAGRWGVGDARRRSLALAGETCGGRGRSRCAG